MAGVPSLPRRGRYRVGLAERPRQIVFATRTGRVTRPATASRPSHRRRGSDITETSGSSSQRPNSVASASRGALTSRQKGDTLGRCAQAGFAAQAGRSLAVSGPAGTGKRQFRSTCGLASRPLEQKCRRRVVFPQGERTPRRESSPSFPQMRAVRMKEKYRLAAPVLGAPAKSYVPLRTQTPPS